MTQPSNTPSPYPSYPYPPSPYQLPAPTVWTGQFDPAGLLRPARRAAILMFVLGAIISLFAMCNIASSLVQSPAEALEAQRKLLGEQAQAPLPISPQALQRIATIV